MWSWCQLAGKTPLLCSWFGHVFLAASDGVWQLDPIDGSLLRRRADGRALVEALSTEQGQDMFLLAGIAIGAERRGLSIGPRQVWAFVPPPVVGGAIASANVMALDLEIGVHLAGQLHRQVRDMPPNTRVTGFVFNEDS